jgi:hypothetical protein
MIYCMAKLTRKQIKELAKSIIASNPGGIRSSSLVDQILQQNPETPANTIHGSVKDLEKQFPQEVGKPSRGLYTPIGTKESDTVSAGSTEKIAPTTGVKVEPFAEWIKNDLDEVTELASLGVGGLKSKWGTPDVVGTYKKLPGNVIEFPVEIASAEIKIDPPELKIKRMRPWWIAFTVGVITAGELGLLIGMYSRDGNLWLRWLDTNTTVTSRLDTPKTLTQVGSPTTALPIASADPQPTDGAPPTAALPIASADPQPTDGAPPTAALPIASADPQPTDHDAEQIRVELHVLVHGQIAVQAEALRHVTDAILNRLRILGYVIARHEGLAFGRIQQTRQHTQGSALTRAIRAD